MKSRINFGIIGSAVLGLAGIALVIVALVGFFS
jgi:hypothetical protein